MRKENVRCPMCGTMNYDVDPVSYTHLDVYKRQLVACLGLTGKGSHQVFFGLSSCVFRFFHGGYSFLLFCFYCSKSMILFRDEVTFLFILDDLVCSYPAA